MKKSKKRAIIKNIGYIVGISIFLFVMNTYNRVQIHEDSLDLYLKPLKTAYIQRYYFLRTLSDQSQVFHLSSSFRSKIAYGDLRQAVTYINETEQAIQENKLFLQKKLKNQSEELKKLEENITFELSAFNKTVLHIQDMSSKNLYKFFYNRTSKRAVPQLNLTRLTP